MAGLLIGWLVDSGRLRISGLPDSVSATRLLGFGLLGAFFVLVGIVLLAIRLRILLRQKNFDVPLGPVTSLTLIGFLFGSVLPGYVAGDAVKAAYLCRSSSARRTELVSVVLADRLIGIFSLFLLATFAGAAAWGAHMPLPAVARALPPSLVAGMFVVVVLAVRAPRLLTRAPAPVRRLADALADSVRDTRAVVCAVLLSLANHALVVGTFVAAGWALESPVSPLAHLAVDPLAMVWNVIPISPGGLGLAEGAFSILYDRMGSSDGALIGIVGRAIQYVPFAVGGTFALVTLRLAGKLRQMKAAGGSEKELTKAPGRVR